MVYVRSMSQATITSQSSLCNLRKDRIRTARRKAKKSNDKAVADQTVACGHLSIQISRLVPHLSVELSVILTRKVTWLTCCKFVVVDSPPAEDMVIVGRKSGDVFLSDAE